ncbi:hypothetical protein PL81_37035 [Streptomyces sp. RSD-27]|nr:hypothetical protein PL81_37035 [Streptomyces sp. RSD-27]
MLTALGATTLLAALWFVPSANATAPDPETTSGAPAAANTGTVTGEGTGDGTIAPQARPATLTVLSLADTGSVDTTPYVMGGTLCLGLGAGFVAFSIRRSRVG